MIDLIVYKNWEVGVTSLVERAKLKNEAISAGSLYKSYMIWEFSNQIC